MRTLTAMIVGFVFFTSALLWGYLAGASHYRAHVAALKNELEVLSTLMFGDERSRKTVVRRLCDKRT
jgi:hypothetical protein